MSVCPVGNLQSRSGGCEGSFKAGEGDLHTYTAAMPWGVKVKSCVYVVQVRLLGGRVQGAGARPEPTPSQPETVILTPLSFTCT